jgi:transcription initiation factor IIE alpha subunit
MSRGYVCPHCKGTITYPNRRPLTEEIMQATRDIHDNSCPQGRKVKQ